MDHLELVEDEFLRDGNISSVDNFQHEKRLPGNKPIFIKTENYEVTLDYVSGIKADMTKFEDVVFSLENLHDSENTKYEEFHQSMENIQRKIIFIDNLLFEKMR